MKHTGGNMGIISSSSSSKHIRSQCPHYALIEVTCQGCMGVDYAQLMQQDVMFVFEIT